MNTENKYARIELRCSSEYKEELKAKARKAHMSMSQYIIALSENKKIIVVENSPRMVYEINRMGNHINEIAAVANAQKFVSEYQLNEVRRYMIDVDKIMNKILKSITDQDDSVDGSVYMKL